MMSLQLMQAKVADTCVALNSACAFVYTVAGNCDTGKPALGGGGTNEIRRILIGRELIGV